ncbi:hypothetical protein NM688_g1078 [Phlebia brevispora]|uniref:Uncharacterized protein n=1 Tax=Phlebia brevispora TaxID=194682 RepID=A0ACC1TC71_9APHY|nr:hypothetical protein NM688_g1078 [Phlebia brevispora]
MSLVVHHYARKDQVQPSADALLHAGWNVARHALTHTWRSAEASIDLDVFASRGNAYCYAVEPPQVHLGEYPSHSQQLKEWDQDLSDDEMYRTADLLDFETSLLPYEVSQTAGVIQPSFDVSSSVCAPKLLQHTWQGQSDSHIFDRSEANGEPRSSTSAVPAANDLGGTSILLASMSEWPLRRADVPSLPLPRSRYSTKDIIMADHSSSMPEVPRMDPHHEDHEATKSSLFFHYAHSEGAEAHATSSDVLLKTHPSTIFDATQMPSSHHEHSSLSYTFPAASPIPGLSNVDSNIATENAALANESSIELELPSVSRDIVQDDSDPANSAFVIHDDSDSQDTVLEDDDSLFPSSRSWLREDSEDPAILVHNRTIKMDRDQDHEELSSAAFTLANSRKLRRDEDEDSIYGPLTPSDYDGEAMPDIQHMIGSVSQRGQIDEVQVSSPRCNENSDSSFRQLVSVRPTHQYNVQGSLAEFIPKRTPSIHPNLPSLSASPSPIPPHSTDSVDRFLRQPFARCAWVIPIRGTPPWAGASEAVFVSYLDHIDDIIGAIVWTPDALHTFWDHIVRIRAAGTCGALGIAFELAHLPRRLSDARESPQRKRLPLLSTLDHIKVHVDTAYAARLRSMLDSWTYPPAPSAAEDSTWDFNEGSCIYMSSDDDIDFGSKLDIEVDDEQGDLSHIPQQSVAEQKPWLQGAILPLVDERNRGVLLI